jgi:hypothetical protein
LLQVSDVLVLIRLFSCGRRFGFIDPPPLGGIEAAVGALKAAQALDEREVGAVADVLPIRVQ